MDRLGQMEPIRSLPMNKKQLNHEEIRPSDYFITSVRRGGQMLIPHGSKLNKPGDELVIVSEGSCVEELPVLNKTILRDQSPQENISIRHTNMHLRISFII